MINMAERENLITPEDKPEETQEQKNVSNSLRQMAENLEGKVSEQSFGEKHISGYITGEANIRGTQIERDPAFRFERGQIFKAYKILRGEIKDAEQKGEDAADKKGLLKEMRINAKETEKNLDELNRQFYENVKDVKIKTQFGDFTIPTVELDLNKNKLEDGEDRRAPYFFLNGQALNFFKSASLPMALALEGQKVYVPMPPEHKSVKKPENFNEMVAKQGDLKIHAEIAKQIIRESGLEKVNLVGWSMGATVALEMASHGDFKELNDLIIAEPLGIENKGLLKLAKEFGLQEGVLKAIPSSETRVKGMAQGSKQGEPSVKDLLRNGAILARQHFTTEDLKQVNPKGRFQVWIGTESPIVNEKLTEKTFLEAQELKEKENLGASHLEFYKVQGGEHYFPVNNALGFSSMMMGEKPENAVTTVKKSDLKNSAIARILGKI